jgi:hypothetical protein
MSAAGGYGAALSGALKELNMYWERTSASWHDAARGEFRKEYIEELAMSIRAAANAMDQIEALLHQVRRECS